MNRRSHGLLDQVDDLIKQAKLIPAQISSAEGSQIQSSLVRYGCLLACAAMEQAIIEGVSQYGAKVGDKRIEHFLSETLKTGRNPSVSYIKEVLSRMDTAWATAFDDYMRVEQFEDKIKSVVSNRNRIAHGEDVSMGVVSLVQWTPAVRKVCLKILDITSDYRLKNN